MTILKIAKVVSSIEFHLPSEKEKKKVPQKISKLERAHWS